MKRKRENPTKKNIEDINESRKEDSLPSTSSIKKKKLDESELSSDEETTTEEINKSTEKEKITNNEETAELSSTAKILSGELGIKPKLKRTLSQIEIQGNKLTRTNSQQIDEEGTAEQINYSTRNYVGGYAFSDFKGKQKDGLKVAVFSRESSENFSSTYHQLRRTDNKFFQLNEGEENETNSKIKSSLLKNVKSSTVNNYDDALTNLFADKEKPHVVAVLEGSKDDLLPKFTLKEDDHSYNYVLQDFSIEDSSNATQHMHFYVREDMQKAITIDKQDITAKKAYDDKSGFKKVTKTKKSTFTVGEIQFETEDEEGSKKYSMLVCHIPNDFTNAKKTGLDKTTHKALQEHEIEGRTVVGYIGDTNYKSVMEDNSIPSVGGNIKGGDFVKGTSSNQIGSCFMQAISTGKDPETDSFIMTQPNTLNDVELDLGKQKPGTDHPSIQTTIVLDSKILGRDYDYIKQKDEEIEEIIEEDDFQEKIQEDLGIVIEEDETLTELEKGRVITDRFKKEVTSSQEQVTNQTTENVSFKN